MSGAPTRADLERFRALVRARFGLAFDDDKLAFLADVLRERVDRTTSDVRTYLERLGAPGARGPGDVEEARALAERLTVTETYFFRYGDQCRAFALDVLPRVARARADARTIRILSAGASSGEEAFTLAMLAREHLPDPGTWHVSILGLDVNVAMLEKARRGVYTAWSLRETDERARRRYFAASRRGFELDPDIRRMVRFEERNLVEDNRDLLLPDAFDVVFCRNVTMYFPEEVARGVIAQIAAALTPGGALFLGHAETLRGLSTDFHLRHSQEAFYYERRETRIARIASAPATDAVRAPAVASTEKPDASWVGIIGDAAERIARLASPARAPADDARPRPDLRAPLELLERERFADAIDAMPREAAGDPDALLLRAVLLTHSGRIPEASEAARALLAVDELNAGAHYVMALCCEHAGEREEAAEHDRAAIHLDDGFAMPHLHLGLLEKRGDDLDAARRAITRALDRLSREAPSRLLLFGGGFSRDALVTLCRAELRACGGEVR